MKVAILYTGILFVKNNIIISILSNKKWSDIIHLFIW